MSNPEIIVCNCLEENSINGKSCCITCRMDLIPISDLQIYKKEIESKLKQLGIDLAIITAEIHLRMVKPIKSTMLHIKKDSIKSQTIKEKGKLEAMELIGLVLADKRENNIIK